MSYLDFSLPRLILLIRSLLTKLNRRNKHTQVSVDKLSDMAVFEGTKRLENP